MNVTQSFLLALKSLLANKMRALLTMLRHNNWCCSGYFNSWTW